MIISIIFILTAIISSIIVGFDLVKNRQPMKIMNAVWILTALWGSVLGLAAYFWFGQERSATRGVDMKTQNMPHDKVKMGESEMQHGGADMNMRSMPKGSMDMHHSNSNGTHTMQMPNRPMWQSVILSTLHCGAGCTLADIVGTILLVFIPISIAGSVVYGGWGFNYLLALVFGVIFQYYAIKPMSRLSNRVIIAKALKSDFFSLTAWQIGMYLWMYIVMYKLDYNIQNSICSWDFWFVMQQAMLVGFILALPINYILIKMGIKGKM